MRKAFLGKTKNTWWTLTMMMILRQPKMRDFPNFDPVVQAEVVEDPELYFTGAENERDNALAHPGQGHRGLKRRINTYING